MFGLQVTKGKSFLSCKCFVKCWAELQCHIGDEWSTPPHWCNTAAKDNILLLILFNNAWRTMSKVYWKPTDCLRLTKESLQPWISCQLLAWWQCWLSRNCRASCCPSCPVCPTCTRALGLWGAHLGCCRPSIPVGQITNLWWVAQ